MASLRGHGARSESPCSSRFFVGGWIYLTMAALLPWQLLADGGTLRVSNVPMGSYRVNVFTDPTPITPDSIDVSILATFERGRGVAAGLDIMVVARSLEDPAREVSHPATRDQATDPRYYSAKFVLGSVGRWNIEVQVRGPEGEGVVRFDVDVQEPGLFQNPFLILALALAPLFLIRWWLKSSGGNQGMPGGSTPSPPPPPGVS